MTLVVHLYCGLSDEHILCQLHTQTKQCGQNNFQQQWQEFDYLKPNHLNLIVFGIFLVLVTIKLSEALFQEHTPKTAHMNHIEMTNTSHNHINKVLILNLD